MSAKLPVNRRPVRRLICLGLTLALPALALLLLAWALGAFSAGLPLPIVHAAPPPSPGPLDPTFGNGGIVTTSIGNGAEGFAVALQPDGQIVIAGRSKSGSRTDFALARYTITGTLDATFGSGGVVTTSIGGNYDVGQAVAIQSDGKIVVVGFSACPLPRVTVARYTPTGTLDTAFGNGGVVTTPVSSSQDAGRDVAIQPDGKIVVVGNVGGVDTDLAVLRYTLDGTPDATFGTGGVVTASVGDSGGYAVALQPDGKIVVAGYGDALGGYDIVVARYTVTGTLDAAFGSSGIVITRLSNWGEIGFGIALQPDGKIVVVGRSEQYYGSDFVVVRYTTAGALDGAFGVGGVVTTSVDVKHEEAEAVVLQPDGKIVVAGIATAASNKSYFVLIRYTITGTLDTTLSTSGVVTTPVGGNAAGRAVALQPDGRIVVAGRAEGDGWAGFALVRYGYTGLTLTQSVAPTAGVPAHSSVTYTIVLSNGSPADDESVTLVDPLPAQVDFYRWVIQPPGAVADDDTVRWSGTISQDRAITFTFVTTCTAGPGETVTNTVRFSGTFEFGSAAAVFHTANDDPVAPPKYYLPLVLRQFP